MQRSKRPPHTGVNNPLGNNGTIFGHDVLVLVADHPGVQLPEVGDLPANTQTTELRQPMMAVTGLEHASSVHIGPVHATSTGTHRAGTCHIGTHWVCKRHINRNTQGRYMSHQQAHTEPAYVTSGLYTPHQQEHTGLGHVISTGTHSAGTYWAYTHHINRNT